MSAIRLLNPRRGILISAAAAVILASASSSPAPEGSYVGVWQGLYPNSQSDNNLSSNCQLCHPSPGGQYNAYGWRIRQILNQGGNITNAILQAESFDSDGDPTGSSNIDEITWNTQPGWTDGPNNTIFFNNGSMNQNQMPPGGISGLLDPSLGTSFCNPAVPNSTGQPGTLAAIGSDLVATNDVTLVAEQLPSNQFGFFLNSMAQNPSGFTPPGSQGLLCIGPGGIGRYNQSTEIFNTGNTGSGALVLDLANTPVPSPPFFTSIQAGETWYFTCWYRDMNPGNTSNFTDALSVTFM